MISWPEPTTTKQIAKLNFVSEGFIQLLPLG